MTTLNHPARALASALLAAASMPAAFAQSAADPQAAAPATVYRPALEYRAAPQPAASPDQGWRAANATVAGYNPMMLTMKSMDGDHAGHAMESTTKDGATPGAPQPAQRKEDAPAAAHDHHRHGERQ